MEFKDLKIGDVMYYGFSTGYLAYEIIGIHDLSIQDKVIWSSVKDDRDLGKINNTSWSLYSRYINFSISKFYPKGTWYPPNEAFEKHRERLLAS